MINLDDLSRLGTLDYGVLAVLGLSALVGLVRGLLQELFSLCLWAGAGWAALHYNHALAAYLQNTIPLESARLVVAFLAIFIGVLTVGSMAGFLLGKLASSVGLGGTDRLAGLLFGVARGALIVALLVMLAGTTQIPQEPWWKQSRLVPPFQSLALWLRGQIPSGLAALVKFPEALVRR